MKSFHMLWIWIFLSGFRNLATDGTDIHGYTGKGATITCSHSWASTNIKYFCRDSCGYGDILVKSDQTPTGRYTLKDHGAGTFTVSITDLQESDSGIYWCAVERFGKDTFKKVKLTVSKDPSKSIITSTQPYKDIQTSTDSLTTTPAAHSESPSVTASTTTRDSSPDNTTHSLSATASVKSTVYILYAVGSLGMIIFAVGLVTVHQYRKKFKISEGFTLSNESKAEEDDRVYENVTPKTNSTQMKPINRTTSRQEQKSQGYSVYENSHALYGNL